MTLHIEDKEMLEYKKRVSVIYKVQIRRTSCTISTTLNFAGRKRGNTESFETGGWCLKENLPGGRRLFMGQL